MSDSLDAIYLEVPRLRCIGKCQEACGPVLMSPAEERRLASIGAAAPDVSAMLESKNLACPLLDPFGRCSIYEARPLVCRLYGAVKAMRCPHGCEPEAWLSDTQASKLIQRAESL